MTVFIAFLASLYIEVVVSDLLTQLVPDLAPAKVKEALCTYFNQQLAKLSSQGKLHATGLNPSSGS